VLRSKQIHCFSVGQYSLAAIAIGFQAGGMLRAEYQLPGRGARHLNDRQQHECDGCEIQTERRNEQLTKLGNR
jgi:hypothetical protein